MITHDQIIHDLMNGVDPWLLSEEVGQDRVNDAIQDLENRV